MRITGPAFALASCASATLFDKPPRTGQHFDYVIIGGGTAGLVLANRLSAQSDKTVAVLEAGSDQRRNPNVTAVENFGEPLHTEVDWQYLSTPQRFAGNASGPGKPQIYDAGKGLGGTSLINGMTYVRSSKAQIDAWETKFGNDGWNWDALLKCYLKSERFQAPTAQQLDEGARYDASVNGFDGPLEVGWQNGTAVESTYLDIKDAWAATGYPQIQDVNAGNPSDFSLWPMTLDRTRGIRWDAARAYLYPIAWRRNLSVFQNTVAQKIVWTEDRDGKAVASGVVLASGQTVYADKEVVVSAGSLRSPAILELSGIGNPSILSQHHIAVKVALPSVGENLQDQPNTAIVAAAGKGRNFTGYPTYVTYPNASQLFGNNASAVASYVRSMIPTYAKANVQAAAPGGTSQQVQESLLRTLTDLLFDSATPVAEILLAPTGAAVVAPFWAMLPFSRGNVHIATKDGASSGAQPVSINPNFFLIDFDGMTQTAAARLARDFFRNARNAGWAGAEASPGTSVVPDGGSDAQWVAWEKQTCELEL